MSDSDVSHGGNGNPGGKESDGQPITLLLILSGVEVVGERSELRSGLLLARQLRPRVVLLDLPDAYEDALSAAGSFKLDAPDIALFLMSNTLDPQVLLKAIRAGAQEVLKKPLDKVLLQEAVERVSRSGAARSAGETR